MSARHKKTNGTPSQDWALRYERLHQEFYRHELTDCERSMADLILDYSFGWGRASVVIPQLKIFSQLTGARIPQIIGALKGLHMKRVIRVVLVRGQATYSICENADSWKVAPVSTLDCIIATTRMLAEFNGISMPAETTKILSDEFPQLI
jgi:hypothetical protein